MTALLDELLAKPVGPTIPTRAVDAEHDFTRELEVSRDTITATLRERVGIINEGTAIQYLREEGQNPDDWEVTSFRKLKWGPVDAPYESVKFSFKRKAIFEDCPRPPLDEMFATVKRHKPKAVRAQGDHAFIVALGDIQFGKDDGDGVEGALRRTIDALDNAADSLAWYRRRYDIGHVHLAWLGDHIEGFVSQGGANVARTSLSLNEQIRLTRRVMLHGLSTFANEADRVTMAAVPGNHGEPQRFAGKGLTKYDDSHDTESLIAVADAAKLNRDAFGHVEFYVPASDEMTVVLDLAGTVVAHAHGHQWKPGKHFEWWRGQAFNAASPMSQANLLLAGHLHHEHVDSDGKRLFIQVPALEAESTWWRHATGTGGHPGIVVAVTGNGVTSPVEVVR